MAPKGETWESTIQLYRIEILTWGTEVTGPGPRRRLQLVEAGDNSADDTQPLWVKSWSNR